METLPSQRHLFEVPDDVAYFNSAYLSPQLRAVSEVGQRAVLRKASPWEVVGEDFFEESERLRELVARLVGGQADNVALMPSVSYAVGTAAQLLPVEEGQSVVVLAEQFPSNVYPWQSRVRQVGARLVTVPRGEETWASRVCEVIDASTAVVALPMCHWTDSTWVDLARVSASCREHGAALVLDLTQSLGAVPFDLSESPADFVIAAAYKWLLGPYGLTFAVVDPRHHGGAPLEHNWLTRADSHDFARLVDYRDDFAPGARRFDMGQRSNFILHPMAIAALEQLLAWRPDRIAATLKRHTDQIAALASALGFEVLTPRGPHMMGLRHPGGLPRGLAAAWRAQGVHVSVRGDAVRVSPHLHIGPDDLTRLEAALRSAARQLVSPP